MEIASTFCFGPESHQHIVRFPPIFRSSSPFSTAPTGQISGRASPFLAGLRHDRIVAPFVLDGPINGDAFTAWVGQCLAPTLGPGDTVIADSLGSHKGLPARRMIRNAGAHLLFRCSGKTPHRGVFSPLQPYSPDLNPIEINRAFTRTGGVHALMLAKLKALFRKADERPVDTSWRRGGNLLDAFTPAECMNDFRHAGYASVQIRDALARIAGVGGYPALSPLTGRDGPLFVAAWRVLSTHC